MTGDIEKDNAALDAYFLALPNGRSFKRIYVNCDNNLMNLRNNGENWQVVLIDEEMKSVCSRMQNRRRHNGKKNNG